MRMSRLTALGHRVFQFPNVDFNIKALKIAILIVI